MDVCTECIVLILVCDTFDNRSFSIFPALRNQIESINFGSCLILHASLLMPVFLILPSTGNNNIALFSATDSLRYL